MQAVAKINLYLAITGRRPDGYHELNTILLPLPDLADKVEVKVDGAGNGNVDARPEIVITCDNPDLPVDSGNLCWQAAVQFCRQTRLAPRVQINLEKRIPVAAGLGGGSSDAAAVLLQLRRQLAPELPDQSLRSLAIALGADVAFFLQPVSALATGIGEVLTPITIAAPLPMVLLAPNFPVTAAWAYQHWQQTSPARPAAPPLPEMLAALAAGNLPAIAKLTHNDLEYCVLEKFPLLRLLRQRLLDLGCLSVHLTGSGPTLFGLLPPGSLAASDLTFLTDGLPSAQAWYFPGIAGDSSN